MGPIIMIMAGRKIEGLPAPPPSTDGFETPSLRPMLLLLLEERWHRSPATTLIMDVVSFNFLILEITPHMSESYSFFWQ